MLLKPLAAAERGRELVDYGARLLRQSVGGPSGPR